MIAPSIMVASQPARPITNQPIDKKSFEKFTQTNLGYLRFRTAGVAASFPESQFQPADNVNYKQHIVSTYTQGRSPKSCREKILCRNPTVLRIWFYLRSDDASKKLVRASCMNHDAAARTITANNSYSERAANIQRRFTVRLSCSRPVFSYFQK